MDVSSPAVAVHEHVPHLVEVVFDETGRGVREFVCELCSTRWFE